MDRSDRVLGERKYKAERDGGYWEKRREGRQEERERDGGGKRKRDLYIKLSYMKSPT